MPWHSSAEQYASTCRSGDSLVDRRKFVGLVALGGMLRPLAGYAQQRAKVPRIGVLAIVPLQSPGMQALVDALEQGLRDRGYIDGKTVLIEYRSAGGKFEQFPISRAS